MRRLTRALHRVIMGVQLLAPSEQQHQEMAFDLFDLDSSGTLTRDEILHMLVSAAQCTHESARLVVKQMSTLDTDGDGRITLTEFKVGAVALPASAYLATCPG